MQFSKFFLYLKISNPTIFGIPVSLTKSSTTFRSHSKCFWVTRHSNHLIRKVWVLALKLCKAKPPFEYGRQSTDNERWWWPFQINDLHISVISASREFEISCISKAYHSLVSPYIFKILAFPFRERHAYNHASQQAHLKHNLTLHSQHWTAQAYQLWTYGKVFSSTPSYCTFTKII